MQLKLIINNNNLNVKYLDLSQKRCLNNHQFQRQGPWSPCKGTHGHNIEQLWTSLKVERACSQTLKQGSRFFNDIGSWYTQKKYSRYSLDGLIEGCFGDCKAKKGWPTWFLFEFTEKCNQYFGAWNSMDHLGRVSHWLEPSDQWHIQPVVGWR